MAPASTVPSIDPLSWESNTPKDAYYSQGLRHRFNLDGLRVAETEKTPKLYADFSYDVDEAAFRRRTEQSLARVGRPEAVPDGWPDKLEGPQVWSSDSFEDESEYVYILTEEDKAEIATALVHFQGLDLDGSKVSRKTFPLPNLCSQLDRLRDDVYQGKGFGIIRGLNPDQYVSGDLAVIYLGISSYIAERRGKQSQGGVMVRHVTQGERTAEEERASKDMPFHTDCVTDCLCLFTQELAASGGRSVISSAWRAYNEVAETRPDLIHVLAKRDWPFDTFGRDPPYYRRGVMYLQDGKLITSFSRRLLAGHHMQARTAGIPGLTEAQAEALDALHFAARRHELKPRMEKGDLRFINNMGVLHRREAFVNGGGGSGGEGAERHLIRLWLNNPDACWSLPRDLRVAWARIFEDEEREEDWEIEPHGRTRELRTIFGSCD